MLAFLAVSTVQVSIILAGALIISRMSRWSAAARHWVLATAACGALATPLLATVLPTWHVAVPGMTTSARATAAADDEVAVETRFNVGKQPASTSSAADRPAPPSTTRRLERLLVVTWAAGAAAGVLVLLSGLLRLRRVASGAMVVNSGPWFDHLSALRALERRCRRVVLLQSTHPSLLVTWGLRTPRIILPAGAAGWDAARRAVVLAHEGAHIRRRDWPVQLVAELLRAVWWFNPLAWALTSRLRLESEHACDDLVLAEGITPAEYASHLVDLARSFVQPSTWVPAPAMARASSLERRVSAMLDSRMTRRPLTRLVRLSVIAIGVAFTASIASFAQSNFATFTGVVHDQLGGTIPKVTLALTHVQSGAKHEIKSNDAGAFEFVGLPSGNYSLAIYAAGFKPLDRPLQFAGGQTLRQDVTLEVGTLQETISVRDGPPSPSPSPRPSSERKFGPDASATCSAQPNSGGIKPPMKIQDKRPIYPASMRGTDIEGHVELAATIGVDGAVKTIQTIKATNPDFELAAQEAVRGWRFTPTLLNCVPIEVEMNVATMFNPESAMPPPPPPPPPPPAAR